jgi:hypothetical protein
MELFERGQRQRIVVTTLLLVVGLAIFGVGLIVFGQAGQIDSAAVPSSAKITLGPLLLMEITKLPLSGSGFTVGIEVLDGMFVYTVCWLMVGVALALLRLKLAQADTA